VSVLQNSLISGDHRGDHAKSGGDDNAVSGVIVEGPGQADTPERDGVTHGDKGDEADNFPFGDSVGHFHGQAQSISGYQESDLPSAD
jgi:hypothetical protein